MGECPWCETNSTKKTCSGDFHKDCWNHYNGIISCAITQSLQDQEIILPPLEEHQEKMVKAYLHTISFIDLL